VLNSPGGSTLQWGAGQGLSCPTSLIQFVTKTCFVVLYVIMRPFPKVGAPNALYRVRLSRKSRSLHGVEMENVRTQDAAQPTAVGACAADDAASQATRRQQDSGVLHCRQRADCVAQSHRL